MAEAFLAAADEIQCQGPSWSYLGWAASGKRVDGNVFQQFYGGLTNDNTDFSLANICWEKKVKYFMGYIHIHIYIYISRSDT